MPVSLLVWMFLQLPALLFARHSIPATLIIEFVAAGMLFPYLLQNLRATGAMILGAAIMLALAAHRSDARILDVLGPWACVAIWLTCLTLAAKAPVRFHTPIVACANLLTVGGLVTWYLSIDFGSASAIASFSPLVFALHM